MSFLQFESEARIADQATCGMSNLRPTDTGLPFIVFISQRDDASHAARVQWSRAPKVRAYEMGSYAISPFGHKAGPRLPLKEERLLDDWIKLNLKTLLDYWEGEIEYTQDAVGALKKILCV